MNTRKRLFASSLVIAAALGVSACSGSQSMQHVDLTDLTASNLEDYSKDAELDELIETWEDVTGQPCDANKNESAEWNATRIHCDSDSVLSVYESTADLKRSLEQTDALFVVSDLNRSRLAGPNWTVSVRENQLEDFHAELGGMKVELGPTQSQD